MTDVVGLVPAVRGATRGRCLPRCVATVGLALLASVAAGCETERSSGSTFDPLLGPRVAESVLCLDVIDGQPVGITDLFEQGEEVHLWVRWENLEPPHVVEAIWYDPLGDEVDATLLDLGGTRSERVTAFRLNLTFRSEPGRWDVELWLDEEFVRSHAFVVVETN